MNEEMNVTATEEVASGESTQEARTYTQEEFQKALESEVDKRVTQAMKTAQRKADARVKEAQKLAQMNEQQRYEYELETREKAIVEKEKALALAENKAEAVKVLSSKGISAQLVDFVVAEDAESMMANISLLEKEFKASVKAEVERRLQTSTPKKNLPTDSVITKKDFKNMKLTEQAELYRNNPDLYKQLMSK